MIRAFQQSWEVAEALLHCSNGPDLPRESDMNTPGPKLLAMRATTEEKGILLSCSLVQRHEDSIPFRAPFAF
jgi:hypothetical protein